MTHRFDYIKILNIYIEKDIINEAGNQRQSGKIICNTDDKGLISIVYKTFHK